MYTSCLIWSIAFEMIRSKVIGLGSFLEVKLPCHQVERKLDVVLDREEEHLIPIRRTGEGGRTGEKGKKERTNNVLLPVPVDFGKWNPYFRLRQALALPR